MAGLLALSLYAVSPLVRLLTQSITTFVRLEVQMVSVERIRDYLLVCLLSRTTHEPSYRLQRASMAKKETEASSPHLCQSFPPPYEKACEHRICPRVSWLFISSLTRLAALPGKWPRWLLVFVLRCPLKIPTMMSSLAYPGSPRPL